MVEWTIISVFSFPEDTADVLDLRLGVVFRRLVRLGSFPACWRQANVIPIPKGPSYTCVANYRPISITPVLSKGFERLVSVRVGRTEGCIQWCPFSNWRFKNIAHHRSVAVLGKLYKIRCNQMHPLYGTVHLYHVFQCVLHEVLWSLIGILVPCLVLIIIMHTTSQYRRTFIPLCISVERSWWPCIRWWGTGRFQEQGQCFSIGQSCSLPYCLLLFSISLFLSMGWYCGAGVFGLIIIIIIKKGRQCKAEREWCTPYQSEDPSPTIPTYIQKEEKGKKSRRL